MREIARSLVSRRAALGRAMEAYDLVVDIGEGDSFATIYGRKRFAQFAGSKLLARRIGLPLIVGPQTLGPWEGRTGRRLAKRVLNGAASVWARDSASVERAMSVGVRPRVGTDLVFALPRDTAQKEDGLILLNVSGLLWKPNSHVDSDHYRKVVHAVLSMARDAGKKVELLPHVIAPGTGEDDLKVCTLLARQHGLQVAPHRDLLAVRGRIAQAELVVGARMHACLNALSQGVACIPLAYSDKFRALFEDIRYTDVVVDLRSASAVSDAAGRFGRATDLVPMAAAAAAVGVARIDEFRDAVSATLKEMTRA
ncbi:polysaccharide pyruvyl transferase family protein [Streptomyces sp. NPDC005098]|uniref:polysaccharide pyruvyl transferase family protein n=1 Tax=Streptomyces sp. NPDC005098 TaxID=3154560 RepID=UPI0033BC47A0